MPSGLENDIQIALAAARTHPSQSTPVDPASADRSPSGLDNDIQIALAAARAHPSQSSPVHPSPTDNSKTDTAPTQPQPAPATSGILGMNRKAMEEERLARLERKRERSISPPPMNESRKAPKLEAETVTFSSGAMLRSFTSTVNQDQQSRKSEAANAANKRLKRSPSPAIKPEPKDEATNLTSTPPDSLKYPHGVVKKTWAFRHDRTGNDNKLEEVLEPSTLRTAVLSAFQWSTEWVLSKLKTPANNGSTKCIFIMQAKEASLREEMLEQTAEYKKFLRLCLPTMEGQINCMHSKLMLLFHPEKLRVAIPTANLLDFDWGETGLMENSVFLIDLPRLPDGRKTEVENLTPFAREMLHFLSKQGLDQDVRSGVLNFDFSATRDMAFVHTVGGANYGKEAERTGLLGLSKAVRELGLQTDADLEIDFAASSIGSLNDEYLRSLHAAARGEDLTVRASQASTKAKADFFKALSTPSSSADSSKDVEGGVDIREQLRIYFPTHDTVKASTAGGAGTICLSRKWYESGTFPRKCFRDYKSTRAGLLSHNKILYARGKQDVVRKVKGNNVYMESKDVAYAYIGSANMSESAWGKLVYDKKAKTWKMNCRNWECGVLLLVPREKLEAYRGKGDVKKEDVREETPAKKEKVPGEDSETESEPSSDSETESEDDEADRDEPKKAKGKRSEDLVGFEVFDDIVKPPCAMPGEKYDGRQPWYFQEWR